MTHEEIRELLGAYVLNAVDEIEHRRVSKHIETCEECAAEVRMLQIPAAELARLPTPEDADELVEKISSSLPWRPRKVMTRLSFAVAAVALVVAGFLGVTVINQNTEQDNITSVIAAADRSIGFDAAAGFGGKGHLYVADGRAVLALDDVPAPGDGKAYQLWSLNGVEPASMTVVDSAGRIVQLFEWDGQGSRFAVTIEPDGGSHAPTTAPVLVAS